MSYREYLEQYHTEQTVKSYLRVKEHFLAFSVKGNMASYSNVIYYLSKHARPDGRVLGGLKKYFDYIIEQGVREDHPCKQLTIKRERRDVQFQEFFTTDELQKLLERKNRYAVLEQRNKAIISLLIYQALTPANIENLRIKDVRLDEGEIYIRGTRTLSRRVLELKSSQAILFLKYIQMFRVQASPNDSLFIGKIGEPIQVDTINRMLRPLKSLFPYRNLNARTIRQSVISNWLNERKIPLDDAQLLSGQKWMSTTEKYVKPDMEKRKGKINEFWVV